MQLQCRRFTSRGSQRSAFWRRTPHIEVASSPFFSPPHETILLSSSSLTWSCLYDPPPPPRIVHRAALRTGSCTGRYPRLSSCVCGSSPARQGRPCCCVEVVLVGVDVSLVVGSRAATKSWDTSGSHFSFFFFFCFLLLCTCWLDSSCVTTMTVSSSTSSSSSTRQHCNTALI